MGYNSMDQYNSDGGSGIYRLISYPAGCKRDIISSIFITVQRHYTCIVYEYSATRISGTIELISATCSEWYSYGMRREKTFLDSTNHSTVNRTLPLPVIRNVEDDHLTHLVQLVFCDGIVLISRGQCSRFAI